MARLFVIGSRSLEQPIPGVYQRAHWLTICSVLWLVLIWPQALMGQTETSNSQSVSEPIAQPYWNVPMPTLGGQQFWTDVECCGNWRIQRNVLDGHHRLLDESDIRRAWGSYEACHQSLQQQKAAGKAQPHSGRLVILLHGLIRTHDSMNRMASYLEQNSKSPVQTICFQYASGQADIGQHAADLALFVQRLPAEVTEISFVAHSMGNIVIRHYLQDTTDAQTGRQGDPRIQRIVMLGPPNQGSRTARLLKHSLAFRTVTGKAGQQLGPGWSKLQPKLATPQQQFAIIAGGGEQASFIEQKIHGGPTDFTVSVAETRLVGATDSLVLPVIHTTMMYDEEVREATLQFLENGYLRTPAEKQPITD